MNKEYAETIVKLFLKKGYQERALFEISSPKKDTRDVLNRLCHNYSETLRADVIFEIPPPNSNPHRIGDILKKEGAGQKCYAMSWNSNIDGQVLPLLDALEVAVGNGMPSILYCFPAKLAYFEAEQEYGPPPRFILKRQN